MLIQNIVYIISFFNATTVTHDHFSYHHHPNIETIREDDAAHRRHGRRDGNEVSIERRYYITNLPSKCEAIRIEYAQQPDILNHSCDFLRLRALGCALSYTCARC